MPYWANFNTDGIGDHIVDAPVTWAQAGKGIDGRALNKGDVQEAFNWAKDKGSLIPFLSAPDRVIITSSSENETSIYDQNGNISFSAAFCMNISGANLKDAFEYTAQGKDACVEVEPVPDNETATTVPSRFDCRAYVSPFSIDQKMINNKGSSKK